jgi:hypothetical protein
MQLEAVYADRVMCLYSGIPDSHPEPALTSCEMLSKSHDLSEPMPFLSVLKIKVVLAYEVAVWMGGQDGGKGLVRCEVPHRYCAENVFWLERSHLGLVVNAGGQGKFM